MPPLLFGIDLLLQQPAPWRNQRLGLVTNDAATTTDGRLSRVALLEKGYRVTTLFSPEHGISRMGEDGARQPDGTDAATGLPVVSLYGDKLAPSPEDLAGLDLLIFDIPDTGCRFYTYLWTMTHVMEASAAAALPLVITDRPNPIGARLEQAEGPGLDEARCASFTGRWNIPLKHACTLGELALYFAATRKGLAFPTIIRMEGYTRSMMAGTDFPYTPTSPALTGIQSALFYPGTGLGEGINVNEGRGTGSPFATCGAPWLDHRALAEKMMISATGYTCTTVTYTPETGLYAGETCHGIHLHCTDPFKLMAVDTGIRLLQAIMELHPEQVKERLYPTAANPSGKNHLDRLLGIPGAFERLRSGLPVNTDIKQEWMSQIQPYLLY